MHSTVHGEQQRAWLPRVGVLTCACRQAQLRPEPRSGQEAFRLHNATQPICGAHTAADISSCH